MGSLEDQILSAPAQSRFPVLFVGHGSPMNVIEDNAWSRGFARLGTLVPRPKAILSISAHWYVEGTLLTGNEQPSTIHDFYGFPHALYEVDYPAKGNVDLAKTVAARLADGRAGLSSDWGLDHGTWSVLRWMYPDADIPVVQLSLDRRLEIRQHFELARSLVELRDQEVLVMGSGNVVHNLRDAFDHLRRGSTQTPDWASRFDATVKQASLEHDTRTLVALLQDSKDGRLAHPTPDHWLPLLYALALTDTRDSVTFPTEGFDLGSLSMRNLLWA